MLNDKLKLNKDMFSDSVEQVPIRKGFGEGLVLAGDENENVVALCADLTESTQMDKFKAKFPERFVEIGVAEQNLVTVSSGMAAMGKIPFCSSYAMFSPGRNWEQIRTTIAYNDRGVIIVGSHAGISVGPDGGTHQAIEDIALMRVLPNMIVISPCDAIEARKATQALAALRRPAYLRLAREKTPIMTTDETPFEIGKSQVVWESEKASVGIIATGALVHKALQVAKILAEAKEPANVVNVKVMNLATIKPLDESGIILFAKSAGRIVTVEEHQIAGGMGSAVAECLAKHFPVPMEFVGVEDKFGQSGTPEELIEHYGMGVGGIMKAVKAVMLRNGK